ncbi:unnamed protein product [Oikopleura dioica]|uniref:Metalloendopeptidase n=1 Tax=Oikopleura dioica TaxID=34765 RepID=E4YU86_OIKDI|nr:unnamed protein product [Oikopleura dioica]
MWTPVVSGGLVTVPWTIDDSLMEHLDRSAIEALQRDLACFDFPYVSKEERASTEYQHGIIFAESTKCSSALGLAPGAGLQPEYGLPSGWQRINLSAGCSRKLSTVQHEILHALGVWHEHERADRDDYITVNFENTDDPCIIKMYINFLLLWSCLNLLEL